MGPRRGQAIIGAIVLASALTALTAPAAQGQEVRCVPASASAPAPPPPPGTTMLPASTPRPCPAGEVPHAAVPSAAKAGAPKGIPPAGRATADVFAKRAGGFHYGSFYDFPSPTEPGTSANMIVAQPELDPQDAHSLGEIAAQSADGQQIVENGWTVDRGVNGGSTTPHLFIFHWVNGVPTCYNGCGFHQVSATIFPGMELTPSFTPRQFTIEHVGSNWWEGVNLGAGFEWIGYFPDSLWSGTYTSIGLAQWFGEVADGEGTLGCTQMGTGALGTFLTAARIEHPRYITASDTSVPANARASVTDPAFYNTDLSTGGFGGPGPCSSPPGKPTITKHPKSVIRTRHRRVTVTFGFAATTAGARHLCAMDSGTPKGCDSPKSYTVRRGIHTFQVRDYNRFGQKSGWQTFSFTVKKRR